MTSEKQPKIILFDIGGVCYPFGSVLYFDRENDKPLVLSPMQAILDFEIANNIPPGWVNYSISRNKPNGFWHRLERGEIDLDQPFFSSFTSDLHNPSFWSTFYKSIREKHSLPVEVPPIPQIDGEALFWSMMDHSRELDPWMYPCLQNLHASEKYTLAGLSNTVIFPPSHPYSTPHPFIPTLFDAFISSAHVHMRKPSPEIYALALNTLRSTHASKNPSSAQLLPSDILFLDDIGENLKAARAAGFRTLKVELGRTYEAVEELERITGLELSGDHPKVPIVFGGKVKAKRRDLKL